MKTKTQTTRILRYLKAGNRLTALSAYTKFHCMRLAARIEELRDDGVRINSRMIRRNGKKIASYSLA